MERYVLTSNEIWILVVFGTCIGIALGLAMASLYVWSTRDRTPPRDLDDPWN